jgi:Inward rectifier potassium channel C-terminal domain
MCRLPTHSGDLTGSSVVLQIQILDIGYDTGEDRLLLWLPVTIKHTINSDSPLASWANMSGFLADADSCIAVTVGLCCCWQSQPLPVAAVFKLCLSILFACLA